MRAQPSVTIDQFKQWARVHEPVARAVLMAQAFAELERERVDAYVTPILLRYEFTADIIDSGRAITKTSQLYLTDDPRLPEFYAELDRAHRAHGFRGPEGHCPALTAEHIHAQAESALIDASKPLFGIDSSDLYGDNRAKFIRLLIGACLKAKE